MASATALRRCAVRSLHSASCRRVVVPCRSRQRHIYTTRTLRYDPRYDPPPTFTELKNQLAHADDLAEAVRTIGFSEIPTNEKHTRAFQRWMAEQLEVTERYLYLESGVELERERDKCVLRHLIGLRDIIFKVSSADEVQRVCGAESMEKAGLRPGFTEEERRKHDELQLRTGFLVKDVEGRMGLVMSTWTKFMRNLNK